MTTNNQVRQGVVMLRPGQHAAWQASLQFPQESILAQFPSTEKPYKAAWKLIVRYFNGDHSAKMWLFGHIEELVGRKMTGERLAERAEKIAELTGKKLAPYDNPVKFIKTHVFNELANTDDDVEYRVNQYAGVILRYIQDYCTYKAQRLDGTRTKAERKEAYRQEQKAWELLKGKLKGIVMLRQGGDAQHKLDTSIELDEQSNVQKMGKNARKRAERYAAKDAERKKLASELKREWTRAFDAFYSETIPSPFSKGRKEYVRKVPPHEAYREKFEYFIRDCFSKMVEKRWQDDPWLLDMILG